MSEHIKDLTAAEMLREARTSGRRKREISTISRQLCIREEYLAALEAGDYASIPEVVYILGFARNYAMELGLDPDEVTAKIKKELGLEEECESRLDADDKEEAVSAPSVASKKNTDASARISFFSKTSTRVYKNWKWFVAGLIALVLAVVAISVFFTLGNDKKVENTTETVAIVVAEPSYTQAVRERFGTDNREGADIILQATQESWVKIEDGRGNTVFSRVLVPGDVYYVPSGDKFKGTFGNAGGIDVWVDGKQAPKLGATQTRKTGVLMTPERLMGNAASAAE